MNCGRGRKEGVSSGSNRNVLSLLSLRMHIYLSDSVQIYPTTSGQTRGLSKHTPNGRFSLVGHGHLSQSTTQIPLDIGQCTPKGVFEYQQNNQSEGQEEGWRCSDVVDLTPPGDLSVAQCRCVSEFPWHEQWGRVTKRNLIRIIIVINDRTE